MKPVARVQAGQTGALWLCLAVSACAFTPRPAPPSAPPAMEAVRMAQRGHGSHAAFERCQGASCPQRTPKTWHTPTTSATSSATARSAAGTTTAPPHDHDSAPVLAPQVGGPVRAPASVPTAALEVLSVQFAWASARLGPAARQALRAAAPGWTQASEIVLSGRTDSTGAAAANDRLALARAQAVLRELLVLAPGIGTRVRIDARGACCFVAANDHPGGRARNRRVEIRYRFDSNAPP